MSFKLMAQALDIKTGSPTAKLVLLKLCDNANDNGICWPSQHLIAEQCEITRETVNRNIKKLVSDGLIGLEHQSRKGAQIVNKYKITLGVTEDHSRCDFKSHLGVTQDHTEPIKEPTNNKNIYKKSLKEREVDFKALVKTTWSELGGERFLPDLEAQKFYLYWTESNGQKMLWEKQKVFDIKKRFKRWELNSYNKNKSEGRNNA